MRSLVEALGAPSFKVGDKVSPKERLHEVPIKLKQPTFLTPKTVLVVLKIESWGVKVESPLPEGDVAKWQFWLDPSLLKKVG